MTYPTSEADIISVSDVRITDKPAGIKRGISETVAVKYGCFYGSYNGESVAVFKYQDHKGRDCGTKVRTSDKRFLWEGRSQPGFFGQHLAGSVKRLVITEGEFDAMAIATATGTKYDVAVSVPDGAATAVKTVKEQIDWLQQFDTVTIAFDMDEPGQKAAKEVARLLPGKVKIVEWERKDANEVLLEDGPEKVKWSVVNARPYTPGGLMSDEQIREAIQEVLEPGLEYPWRFMDEVLLGQRRGEITVWLAGSGIGKSTILGQVGSHVIQSHGSRLGAIFLEDSPREVILRMLSFLEHENLYAQEKIDPELLLEMYDEKLSGRLSVYDPRTGWDITRITEAIRWMAVGEECPVVILDHLSAVIGVDSEANEIAKAEQLMYQLRRVAITTGTHIHVVSHLRKKGGNETIHEEGGRVTLQDGKGTGAIFQVANTIVALERNTQAEDEERDVTSVRILKNRATGWTGEAGRLLFNREKYRLEEYDGGRSQEVRLGAVQEDDQQQDSSPGGADRVPF